MATIEDIKRNWVGLKLENERLKQANMELTRRLAADRICSTQKKLAKAYRIGYMGFMFPLLALLLHYVIDASLGLCIFYAIFGLACAFYDLWFMGFVRDMDYINMPVVEAVIHASKVVRYQNRATVISIVGAVSLIVPLFIEIARYGDTGVLWGGVAGLIIGGIIGTLQCIRNHRYARRLLREIKNI